MAGRFFSVAVSVVLSMLLALTAWASGKNDVWTNPFTDISETDPRYTAVRYVCENGLLNGISDTEFAPDASMTRAMFVTVLGRLHGGVDPETVCSFADCEPDAWYGPYVGWAAANGIVQGYHADAFGPQDAVTVEQALVILLRYARFTGYTGIHDAGLEFYTDGDAVSEWALDAVKWGLACEIYKPNVTLHPQKTAQRSLVAQMLYRYQNR